MLFFEDERKVVKYTVYKESYAHFFILKYRNAMCFSNITWMMNFGFPSETCMVSLFEKKLL